MAKKITQAGLLTALAFALSYLEFLVPIQAVVPIPGVKLGLANIVTMFALFHLSRPYALGITVVRCLLLTALFGSVTTFLFSLSGGLLAFCIMSLLLCGHGRWFSLFGISIAGAAAHNIGQIACATIYFRTVAVVSYLPFLLLLSIPLGFFTAYLCQLIFQRLEKISGLRKMLGDNQQE